MVKEYRRNVTIHEWGYRSVEADSLEEAERKFEDGDYEEYINKSDCVNESITEVQ